MTFSIQTIGDSLITRSEYFKALLIFTPASRLFSCKGEAYHRRVNRIRTCASFLLSLVQPRLGIKFTIMIAALAEGLGGERIFRRMVILAYRRSRLLEQRLQDTASDFEPLVHFHIRMMDFAEALRVVEQCKLVSPDQAFKLEAKVVALQEECASWLPAIEAARIDLRARTEGQPLSQDDSAIDLYIPSGAFGIMPLGYHGFQADIRRAFKEVIAILDEESISYRPRFRLATHGTLPGESRPFIAYHSVSKTAGGLHIKESDRRHYFSADHCGYSGWSEFSYRADTATVDVTYGEVDAFLAAERRALISSNISKYDQPPAGTAISVTSYVFVALQVMDDAVQRLSHMHMFDMLEEICDYCEKHGLDVIVKRHPRCSAPAMSLALRRGLERGKFILSDASVHDLIAGALAVCTVNSGVGAEALLHGKPVYCFGAAEYQQACFQVKKRGDFARIFQEGALPRPRVEIDCILYAMRHFYSTNVRDEDLAKQFWRKKLSPIINAAREHSRC